MISHINFLTNLCRREEKNKMGKSCCWDDGGGGGIDPAALLIVVVLALLVMAVCTPPQPRRFAIYRCRRWSVSPLFCALCLSAYHHFFLVDQGFAWICMSKMKPSGFVPLFRVMCAVNLYFYFFFPIWSIVWCRNWDANFLFPYRSILPFQSNKHCFSNSRFSFHDVELEFVYGQPNGVSWITI